VEKTLVDAGIMGMLREEELSSSFADELHGVKYPFKREMVGEYV
jgi:hypothetical protein